MKATDLFFTFKLGEHVTLLRSKFPGRNGMSGTVVKLIKSRRMVRFLRDDAKSENDTYDAEPEGLGRNQTPTPPQPGQEE